MTKSSILKIVAVITITALLGVFLGFLASKAIKEVTYYAYFGDKLEEAENRFDSYFDTLFKKLENDGLIGDRPNIEFEETMGHISKRTNFSVENFSFEIDLAYRVFNDASVITVGISEIEKQLTDIDAFENEKVNCVLSILDECFETESFNKANEFCNRSFLIDNYSLNKNNAGVAEYNFGTHGTVYDAFSLHKTETTYSYSVSALNSVYEYKTLIKYSL